VTKTSPKRPSLVEYKGKSTAEIIEMHQAATRKITEQGQFIADLNKKVDVSNLTPDDVKKNLKAADLKSAFTNEQNKLSALNSQLLNIDPVLDEAKYADLQQKINDQANLVNSVQADWLEKTSKEQADLQFNSAANMKFIAEKADALKQDGFELSKEEFQTVTDAAADYAENGRLTDASYHHALIDQFGLDKVMKLHSIKAEGKAREEIAKAAGKVQPKVDVSGSGKNAKLIRFADMSAVERDKMLDGMSPSQLEALKSRINR